MSTTSHLLLRGDARRLPLPSDSVDLVFASPPYLDARTYGIGAQRDCESWIDWMLDVTTEAARVSRGPVVWVAAGVTRQRNYQPGPEGLMYRWWKRGGECQLYRPCYWHRVGIPGSGGKDWFRADVEYVMCFKRLGELAWSDPLACAKPPKFRPGGAMSHRMASGCRVNEPVSRFSLPCNRRSHGGRRNNDTPNREGYEPPEKANPGNLVKTSVGGGHAGHDLAHENEAPFTEELAEFFVKSLCPPGGVVLDCFSGSGTTASVAVRNGRRAIGLDLRMSQCELGSRRIAEQLVDAERPHRKDKVVVNHVPLAGQLSFLDAL
jgi:hypothetical protein